MVRVGVGGCARCYSYFREEAVLALLLIRVRTRVQVSPSPNPHPNPNQVLVFREEG